MCSKVSAAVEGVVAAAGGPAEEILALVELADRAQAALVERVAAFDAAEGWAADGAFSFPCWLRARADVSRAESLQLGRFARTLRTMPVTEEALRQGELSVAKARLLAGVVNERTEEKFAEQEAFLVEQVQVLPVDSAKTALDYWKQLADSDGADPSDPSENWARLAQGYRGRWHLEASLDQVSGTMLKALLDSIVDRMHQDGRFNDLPPSRNTAAHRTGQAVVEMGHRASGARPDQPAVHPDIVVVVPHHALTAPEPDPFDPPTLVGGGPLTLSEVWRLAVLGTVSTMTVDDAGRPLRLGRKQRLATADQWIAASVRDRGCVIPGCDRPAAWCQAHHLQWWERDSGLTDLENLALVCSHHHHLIHDAGWTLQPRADGTWQLTRPNGTTVANPRYPGNQRPPPHHVQPAA